MNIDLLKSWVRHLLTLGGGFLIAKGWVDAPGVESLIGGALTLTGLIWSWVTHAKPKQTS